MQCTSRHDIKFYTALLVGINTGSGSNSIAVALADALYRGQVSRFPAFARLVQLIHGHQLLTTENEI